MPASRKSACAGQRRRACRRFVCFDLPAGLPRSGRQWYLTLRWLVELRVGVRAPMEQISEDTARFLYWHHHLARSADRGSWRVAGCRTRQERAGGGLRCGQIYRGAPLRGRTGVRLRSLGGSGSKLRELRAPTRLLHLPGRYNAAPSLAALLRCRPLPRSHSTHTQPGSDDRDSGTVCETRRNACYRSLLVRVPLYLLPADLAPIAQPVACDAFRKGDAHFSACALAVAQGA